MRPAWMGTSFTCRFQTCSFRRRKHTQQRKGAGASLSPLKSAAGTTSTRCGQDLSRLWRLFVHWYFEADKDTIPAQNDRLVPIGA